MVKFDSAGPPVKNGQFTIYPEKRRHRARRRWKLVAGNGATLTMFADDLFDLADLLDELCDSIADRDEEADDEG